jgi:hypothetical protein
MAPTPSPAPRAMPKPHQGYCRVQPWAATTTTPTDPGYNTPPIAPARSGRPGRRLGPQLACLLRASPLFPEEERRFAPTLKKDTSGPWAAPGQALPVGNKRQYRRHDFSGKELAGHGRSARDRDKRPAERAPHRACSDNEQGDQGTHRQDDQRHPQRSRARAFAFPKLSRSQQNLGQPLSKRFAFAPFMAKRGE